MRIAITGASGFIGSRLVGRLTAAGHNVQRVGRVHEHGDVSKPQPQIVWDPATRRIDRRALEGIEAVIHLAGESIAQRWTDAHKRAIRQSRLQGTSLLCETLAHLDRKPTTLISVSAVGFYGDSGDAELDESSPTGGGFLAGVTREWEAAAEPARVAGIRVVHPRMGIVLNPLGGALERLLPIFSIGAGGRIASGRQWMSWIALTDLLSAFEFVLASPTLVGPVNFTAPSPVTNAEFSDTLARVLHRPALAVVPEFAVRLVYGQMGEETVVFGQRVLPKKLLAGGFQFGFPTLEPALRHELPGDGQAAAESQ